MNGAARVPVTSQTASDSAISDAAAAKSPPHTAAVPRAPSMIGSWSSAPTSRASRTCRRSMARQASSSHSALAAACASQPHRMASSRVTQVFADLHRDHGVDLRFGVQVAEFTGSGGRADGVRLADGSRVR